jgi:hypothetical protein
MKFFKTNSENIGLLVELPTGPHIVDVAKSLGLFAARDPVAGALINGTLKEKSVWTALVNHWQYLRMPLTLLARTALADPDDPRLVLYPFADARQTTEPGIVALDITDAADLESHDPTGRLVMARQFSESVAEHTEQDSLLMGENVQVIDFTRHNGPRTRRK